MKSKSILLLIGLLVCATIIVNAQTQTDDARIKVLPSEKPGVIKIIHALHTDQPVLINFSNQNGIVKEDRIKGDYPKGILVRYDVHRMLGSDFRVEIKSQNVNVTYKIIPSKDRQKFTAYLEKVEHHNLLLASR